jgi:hypothetical protein
MRLIMDFYQQQEYNLLGYVYIMYLEGSQWEVV